jgi:hypothetical protein
MGAQSLQNAEPSFEYVPGVQDRHPELEAVPKLGEYVPAGQDSHEVPETKVPGGHCLHVPQYSVRIDPEGHESIENDVNSEFV